MQTIIRQSSTGPHSTTSIAHIADGMSFAAQARAHELRAFRSNKDRNQTLQAAQEPSGAVYDGNEEFKDMPRRRQKWQRLDLHGAEQSPAVESDIGSDAFLDMTEQPGQHAASGQLDAVTHCTSRLVFRRRAESKLAVLVNATHKRRANSGEHDSLDISPTDTDTAQRASPFPSDQSTFSLPHDYGAHILPPVVNLPAASVRPLNSYPAVKGTDHQKRQVQASELRDSSVLPPSNLPAFLLSDIDDDSSTPGDQQLRQQALYCADPFEKQSNISQNEQLQQDLNLSSQPLPPKTSSLELSGYCYDPPKSFIPTTLKEHEAMKHLRKNTANEAAFDEDHRYNRETRDAVAYALRAAPRPRTYSMTMVRPLPPSNISERRPVFGGYVFSTSPDRSFERQEQDESDDVFHRLLLPVMANLKSYSFGEKDYFNPFVRAPEWTIDHGPAGRQSYFGEDWGTPPARVGRDPRYRVMQHESRGRDDLGNSAADGFQAMQTPVRPAAAARYRNFQDFSGSSGSTQYSAQRGFRAEEDQGMRGYRSADGYTRRHR